MNGAVASACSKLATNNRYAVDEARYVCFQAQNGDRAYKVDFEIVRYKGNSALEPVATINQNQCEAAFSSVLDGTQCHANNFGGRTTTGEFSLT